MPEHLQKHQFQPLTLDNTRLEFWAERDRLNIGLVDCRKNEEKQLLDYWDEDAAQLFEDGFLSDTHFIMGRLRSERGLHEELLNHYFYLNPQYKPKSAAA